MVKFTQTQFQVDPSKSSILTGGVVVPSAIIGKEIIYHLIQNKSFVLLSRCDSRRVYCTKI
jgi:hypothetical protein